MRGSPLWISMQTAGCATLLVFLAGPFAAWMAAKSCGLLRRLLDCLFLLPMVLPPTVVGYLLLLTFGRNGLLGPFLDFMGVRLVFTWSATVISAAIVAFPLMYRTAAGAFAQLPTEILEAARTLGVSEGRIFLRIAIPNAWPGLRSGLVLTFSRALGEFGATMMLAGNIPGKTQTLPMAIYSAVEGGQSEQAIGWVLVVMVLSIGSMLFLTGKGDVIWTGR
jgi:molybdate transport system permease protein